MVVIVDISFRGWRTADHQWLTGTYLANQCPERVLCLTDKYLTIPLNDS